MSLPLPMNFSRDLSSRVLFTGVDAVSHRLLPSGCGMRTGMRILLFNLFLILAPIEGGPLSSWPVTSPALKAGTSTLSSRGGAIIVILE